MTRVLQIIQTALLAGLLVASLAILAGTPIRTRLPANDVLLLQPVTGPMGQPGIIGEQLTVKPDGGLDSKVGN